MKMSDLIQYAKQLGCSVVLNTFDAGQKLRIEREDGALFQGSYYWGEEESFFARVTTFLHGLTWPSEDDPRVQHELVTA